MASTSASRVGPAQIAGYALGVAAVGALGYAVYFDHKRRNDPAFRRRLRSQQQQLAQAAKTESARQRTQSEAELRRILDSDDGAPPPPEAGPEAAEAYFLSEVAAGEQLALGGPAKYAEAAAHFYRALSVYPAPHELLMIYQKTQPQEVVQLIMTAAANGRRGGSSRGGNNSATIEELAEPSPPSSARRSRTASSTASSPASGNGNSYVNVNRADAGN